MAGILNNKTFTNLLSVVLYNTLKFGVHLNKFTRIWRPLIRLITLSKIKFVINDQKQINFISDKKSKRVNCCRH